MQGAEQVILNNKQTIGLDEIDVMLKGHIQVSLADVVSAVWNDPCWFGSSPSISSAVASTISLSAARGATGEPGFGNLVATNAAGSNDQQVAFENLTGQTYHVGVTSAFVKTRVKTSKHSGIPQYTAETQIVGFGAAPTAATPAGSDVVLEVDDHLEPGHNHSGRTFIVWMLTPGDASSNAIANVVSTYSAGHNKLTILNAFNQSSPSSNEALYYCVLQGPLITTVDITSQPGVVYVGTVSGNTGNKPVVFDTSASIVVTTLPDLANVIEYGHNGDLKIVVKPSPADGIAPVAQIAVRNGLEYPFVVDQYGGIIMRPAGGNQTCYIGGTTGVFRWNHPSGDKSVEIGGTPLKARFYASSGDKLILSVDQDNNWVETYDVFGTATSRFDLSTGSFDNRKLFTSKARQMKVPSSDALSDANTSENLFATSFTFPWNPVADSYIEWEAVFYVSTAFSNAGQVCTLRIRLDNVSGQVVGVSGIGDSASVGYMVIARGRIAIASTLYRYFYERGTSLVTAIDYPNVNGGEIATSLLSASHTLVASAQYSTTTGTAAVKLWSFTAEYKAPSAY